ncbi:GntR family transcriptional regulator [Enterococcus innesii]|uniref:GntR family transcriptional regulator n=1 Tax=Enterococcus innesii TaxID=2839759 RepID=A0ABM7XPN0_9ENTE|nr:GntR family transcriptional regulator [Enterococcus innesii]BDG66990.1 GntR family transcriptional regulator [Enterococcus innesii]
MTKLSIEDLAAELIRKIEAGDIGNEQGKMPSERELLAIYPVSRYTLRQALNKLSKMGWIYQMQGRGSYIRFQSNQKPTIEQGDLGFNEDLTRGEKNIRTVKASKRLVKAADALFLPSHKQFAKDQHFIEVQRFRTLDNKPYLIERSYYIPEIVGEISETMMDGSMFQALAEEKQLTVAFIDKFIQSKPLTKEQAAFFHLEEGMPALIVRDDSYLRNGELLAFSMIHYDYRMATLYMHKKIIL